MEKKSIANKIRNIRKACGFTQQQIANILSVDRSTYTYYETGKTMPDIRTMKVLARLFNVSIDDLLAEEEGAAVLSDAKQAFAADEASLPAAASQLTKNEREMLVYYRSLSPTARKKLLDTLREQVKEQTDEE